MSGSVTWRSTVLSQSQLSNFFKIMLICNCIYTTVQWESFFTKIWRKYLTENCRIVEIQFWRSAFTAPQYFLVHTSTIDLVVGNIAEARLKLRVLIIIFANKMDSEKADNFKIKGSFLWVFWFWFLWWEAQPRVFPRYSKAFVIWLRIVEDIHGFQMTLRY